MTSLLLVDSVFKTVTGHWTSFSEWLGDFFHQASFSSSRLDVDADLISQLLIGLVERLNLNLNLGDHSLGLIQTLAGIGFPLVILYTYSYLIVDRLYHSIPYSLFRSL